MRRPLLQWANLMYVTKIADCGLEIHFRRNDAVVVDSNGNVQLWANKIGDLYVDTCITHVQLPVTVNSRSRASGPRKREGYRRRRPVRMTEDLYRSGWVLHRHLEDIVDDFVPKTFQLVHTAMTS
ncbi:hypothetical protein Zmor_023487 [Zophobas morio]|uniref:Uncharacterized protein n=1 Tax=Zophobas morio TaxID=2755281 RepID=A0AA38M7F7_9CUCU|nr:hypothetical protein Zmor_023487 [Zophobas morio]